MKTYTLPVKAMAQLISGTTYDKVAQSYVMDSRLAFSIYVQFDPLPAALLDVAPESVALHFYVGTEGHEYISHDCYGLFGKLDIENDIFPTPDTSDWHTGYLTSGGWQTWTISDSRNQKERDWIINGIALRRYNYQLGRFYSPTSSYVPYAVLNYNEGSLLAVPDAPAGYVDRTQPVAFSWHTTWTGFPVENVAQTSATLQWKNGSSGTVNSISISGSATSYAMAANTLPESEELYWRIQTVTADGSATSEWRSIRTVDTPAVTVGVSPAGAYIDGAQETRFVWNYQTASGTLPTGYDLQVKGPLDADFSTVQSENTQNAFAVVPAGTLPPGTVLWRVRGYNQSGVAGEWSAPLQTVVIAAPNAPEVWIESATPRPIVAWTATGQLAYQVRVGDAYDSGTIFGTDKTFKIPVYLADGETPIQVRILGEYDYWSPWASAAAQIENGSTETVILTAQAQDGDALLSWTAAENAEKYLIYRQGRLIAETVWNTYTDPYAIGSVTYRVRAVFADSDDYALSNSATVLLSVPALRIITPGGAWIDLGLTTEPLPAAAIVSAQQVSLMTYAGVEYPVPEVAPHKTRTYTWNPAFRTVQEANALIDMVGKVVFLKDQNGSSMTGVMTSAQMRPSEFYTVCSITVNEIGGVAL